MRRWATFLNGISTNLMDTSVTNTTSIKVIEAMKIIFKDPSNAINDFLQIIEGDFHG